MVVLSHQTFRRICPCNSCGTRTQCISKDGGFNFYCNRCGVAYGAFRGKFYDDPKLAEVPKAEYDTRSGQPIEQTKVEVKTEVQAMKEMEDLVKKGVSPQKARGKVFNKKTIIKEESETNERTTEKTTT